MIRDWRLQISDLRSVFLIILVMVLLSFTPGSLFSFSVSMDSCGQRTDGSKFFDVWYTLEGINNCVQTTILPITTVTNETLLCETFLESSDTGLICDAGSYHVIWDIGNDIPGREFFNNKIEIEIIAAKPGVVPGDCGCSPCVDIDGNIYETVQIGGQCWMAENLKVIHYRDGTPIPNVTDASTWGGLSTGAYCEYANDPSHVPTYGRLYNGYAVLDPRGLAPARWHLPTEEEWKTLEMYLGMNPDVVDSIGWRGTDEGGKLKEEGTEHWASPNTGATNESEFTALPGGYRDRYGRYYNINYYSFFWSSSRYGSFGVWYRGLYFDNAGIHSYGYNWRHGFSIRCVQD